MLAVLHAAQACSLTVPAVALLRAVGCWVLVVPATFTGAACCAAFGSASCAAGVVVLAVVVGCAGAGARGCVAVGAVVLAVVVGCAGAAVGVVVGGCVVAGVVALAVVGACVTACCAGGTLDAVRLASAAACAVLAAACAVARSFSAKTICCLC